MTKTRLGKSEVQVTKLGLGTNAVGGHNLYPNLDEKAGIALVKSYLEHGGNFIDTAFVYGLGRSEELIGEAITGFDRSSIVIATKAAHEGAGFNNSPDFLRKSVDIALSRLKTDYIDVFYIHFPDPAADKRAAVESLQKLKEKGIIRAIGVSNFSLDDIKQANADGFVDVVQDKFNLLERDAEKLLFPYLRSSQISFVPYFPLASGLLTGKYTDKATFAAGDFRGGNVLFQGEAFKNNVERISQLHPLADKYGTTVTNIVLAWYLKNPDITAVIPGAKRPDQVAENLKAADITLSDADFTFIDDLFS